MKNISIFLSEKFHFLVVKFSVYLNRHVFVMIITFYAKIIKLPVFVMIIMFYAKIIKLFS